MKAVFLETSALLRILFGEEGGDTAGARLRRADRVVASRLLQIECERALLRIALDHPETGRHMPEFERTLRTTWSHIDMIEMTRDICELAGRIAPRVRLRSLDAIHLATFHRLREIEPSAAMLTFDQRLLDAL